MIKKTFFITLITIFMVIITATPCLATASATSNHEKAVDLKLLGLFNGTTEGFELERVPTRVEGAAMLLRLLGKEKEAQDKKLTHPFSDVPAWAEDTIGYMYSTGLTKGIGDSLFGSEDTLTAGQYVTFVLRALGYSEKNNDFKYENALDKAVTAGLLTATESNELRRAADITRNDLVSISYSALKTNLKSSSFTLLDKLALQDEAVSGQTASALGLYVSELQGKYGNVASYKPSTTKLGYAAKNSTDFYNILKKSIYLNESTIKIDLNSYSGKALDDFEALLENALEAVTTVTGVEYPLSSWKYSYKSNVMTLNIVYRYSKSEYQLKKQQAADTLNKARHVVSGFIKPGMSDYDKELYIHDYIVNNTKYDYDNYLRGTIPDTSFDAYGSLILGIAVCEGYSEAFKLLGDLSGLECLIVGGTAAGADGSETNHAWNIVRVDNNYYHVDSTFNDPVAPNGKNILSYEYFNLTDKALSGSHTWDEALYPSCSTNWVMAAR